MAANTTAVTTWAGVVAQMLVFATARGWGAGPTIVNPVTGTAYDITALADGLTVTMAGSSPLLTATTNQPRLGGANEVPDDMPPITLFQFGSDSPYHAIDTEPFLAFVIAFGPFNFRHVYIGGLVKIGNYTAGDVFTANRPYTPYSTSTRQFYDTDHRYTFRACCSQNTNGGGGGAKIIHADNPITYREFSGPANTIQSTLIQQMNGTEIFGGNGDGVNDGLTHRAKADFAAKHLLMPVNLYVPNGNDGANYRIRPLGFASGARMVNMEGLEPTSRVTLGADSFRCFPEYEKRIDTFTRGSGGVFPAYETSKFYGMAYREN